jgi:hypothetical protein
MRAVSVLAVFPAIGWGVGQGRMLEALAVNPGQQPVQRQSDAKGKVKQSQLQ